MSVLDACVKAVKVQAAEILEACICIIKIAAYLDISHEIVYNYTIFKKRRYHE